MHPITSMLLARSLQMHVAKRRLTPASLAWMPWFQSAWPRRLGLWFLFLLATVQFVGSEIYLEWPYLNVKHWEYGHAPLPFQTRLLLAPLYRYIDSAAWSRHIAANLAHNHYFFSRGVTPALVLEFVLGIVSVLVSGWVAMRFYQAASRRHLVHPLVYPLFLILCTLSYIVHTVQNFRFVYDLPSMALFAIGLYLIYFKKPLIAFILLYAMGTLNRETTLLLLPFWAVSQVIDEAGGIEWRKLVSVRVLSVLAALGLYWTIWHRQIYGIFPHNPSEYYPRIQFNLKCFMRLRYWPQLASAFGYTWPFLLLYHRKLRDPQLRAWLLVLPIWYAFMFEWGILTETRIFGELLPFLAPVCAILGEEVFAAKVLASKRETALPAEATRNRERAA